MQRTTSSPQKSSLRRELELYVIAWNNCLKEAVSSMDLITLLRNAHPTYRGDFAVKLKNVGLLSSDQAGEFIKLVK